MNPVHTLLRGLSECFPASSKNEYGRLQIMDQFVHQTFPRGQSALSFSHTDLELSPEECTGGFWRRLFYDNQRIKTITLGGSVSVSEGSHFKDSHSEGRSCSIAPVSKGRQSQAFQHETAMRSATTLSSRWQAEVQASL